MKKLTTAWVLGGSVFLLSTTGLAAPIQYTATLAPPAGVTSLGAGTATLTLEDTTNVLTGTASYANLTGAPTLSHIHELTGVGAISTIGPATGGTTGTAAVNLNLMPADVTRLNSGVAYVQFHTAANGGGEIRGNITRVGAADGGVDGGVRDGGTDGGVRDGGTDGGGTGGGDGGGTGGGDGGGTGGGVRDSGTGTTRDGGGTPATAQPAEDEGCSTTGTRPNGALTALGLLAAVGLMKRRRRS